MRSTGFVALLALLPCIFFCGCMPDSAQVTVVLPLSGADAATGNAVLRGVELALEEMGEEPILRITTADSHGDPQRAAQLLDTGFQGGAMAAIGGVGVAETEALLAVAERFERALLSPAAPAPHLSGISPSLYRIAPSERPSAVALAMTAGFLKANRAVVITQPSLVGPGSAEIFADALRDHGGKVLKTLETEGETASLLHEITADLPDVVYLTAAEKPAEKIINVLRENYLGPILIAGALSDEVITKLGSNAQDIFLSRAVVSLGENDSGHFLTSYRQRFGTEPDIFAAYGYDAIRALTQALEGRALLPSELRKGLRDAEIAGVTGLFDFDHKGDIPRYPRVYRVAEGGKLVDFKEELREQEFQRHERRRMLQAEQRALNERLQDLGG